MRRMSSTVALAVLIAVSSGCYHYRLRAKSERINSSPFRKTFDSSGKDERTLPPADKGAQGSSGLPSSADCKDNGLHEVGITSHWKYAAGTVFSFGRWSRVKAEWFCAKEPPVIGPTGSSQPPALVSGQPQKKSRQDGFTKKTVHSFFWGALQHNLVPPASSPTSKTPANCRSMGQVKLPMNYGYSLITVATLGIWSPMRVAWQCKE
jgi:hypothetical protein